MIRCRVQAIRAFREGHCSVRLSYLALYGPVWPWPFLFVRCEMARHTRVWGQPPFCNGICRYKSDDYGVFGYGIQRTPPCCQASIEINIFYLDQRQ